MHATGAGTNQEEETKGQEVSPESVTLDLEVGLLWVVRRRWCY